MTRLTKNPKFAEQVSYTFKTVEVIVIKSYFPLWQQQSKREGVSSCLHTIQVGAFKKSEAFQYLVWALGLVVSGWSPQKKTTSLARLFSWNSLHLVSSWSPEKKKTSLASCSLNSLYLLLGSSVYSIDIVLKLFSF